MKFSVATALVFGVAAEAHCIFQVCQALSQWDMVGQHC